MLGLFTQYETIAASGSNCKRLEAPAASGVKSKITNHAKKPISKKLKTTLNHHIAKDYENKPELYI